MRLKLFAIKFLCIIVLLAALGCSRQNQSRDTQEIVQLKSYPMNSLAGVLTSSGVGIDSRVTSDGAGSLHISASQPTTVRLYETGDLDVENARLLYQARIRTQDVKGQVYLEMWCHFPGKGEFFSRALHAPISGSTDWTTQETPFFLKKGENPDNVKLNLVVNGTGSVWIDDIRLTRGPLH